jgi:hypothetical protein
LPRRAVDVQTAGIWAANAMDDEDPRREIARLEEHIESLTDKMENCRKFILAARVALAAGALVLIAMLFGAIRADLTVMAAAMAASIGGIVVWGSNAGTAKEAAEASRTALIGQLELRTVAERPTLH